jgi:hypothetical protein
MGNFKIIMKFNFYILLILILSSCNQNKLDLSETNQDYHLTKSIVDPEESIDFIEASKEFELKHNEIFQQDLQIKSKEYYDNVIKSFIDEETGVFNLLGELWDRAFKTETERKTLWKLKIERYFRTTSFLTYIRNEVTIYTEGINNQRKNGVSKILGTKHSSNLKLPIVEVNSFNIKNDSTENVISKINDEIKDQLISIPFDGVLTSIIVFIVGVVFGTISSFTKNIVGFLITILCCVVFFIRSNMRQSEMKDILKTECYKTLDSTKIDCLDQLNINTIGYYSQLQKINYETNK